MKRGDWRHNALVVMATLASTVLFYSASTVLLVEKRPPVVFHKSEVHTPTVQAGGTFDVTVYRDINYACDSATVHKWWVSPTGDLKYFGARPIAGDMSKHIGNPKFTLRGLPVPETLTPGRWCYSPKVEYHCGQGDRTVRQTPACVEVTE